MDCKMLNINNILVFLWFSVVICCVQYEHTDVNQKHGISEDLPQFLREVMETEPLGLHPHQALMVVVVSVITLWAYLKSEPPDTGLLTEEIAQLKKQASVRDRIDQVRQAELSQLKTALRKKNEECVLLEGKFLTELKSQKEVESMCHTSELKVADLETKLRLLKEDKKNLTIEVGELEDVKREVEEKNVILKGEVTEHQDFKKKVTEEDGHLKKQIKEQEQVLIEVKNENDKLHREVTEHQDFKKKVTEEDGHLKKQIKEQEQILIEVKKENDKLHIQVTEHQKKLDANWVENNLLMSRRMLCERMKLAVRDSETLLKKKLQQEKNWPTFDSEKLRFEEMERRYKELIRRHEQSVHTFWTEAEKAKINLKNTQDEMATLRQTLTDALKKIEHEESVVKDTRPTQGKRSSLKCSQTGNNSQKKNVHIDEDNNDVFTFRKEDPPQQRFNPAQSYQTAIQPGPEFMGQQEMALNTMVMAPAAVYPVDTPQLEEDFPPQPENVASKPTASFWNQDDMLESHLKDNSPPAKSDEADVQAEAPQHAITKPRASFWDDIPQKAGNWGQYEDPIPSQPGEGMSDGWLV